MSKVYPLKDNQAHAVHPQRTVWLSASAGTGKTQVLSARVLRLLLQDGVEPEQILCLTFTKAGAAEMATRVNEVLAGWVRMPATDLAAQLKAIGAPFGPETVARARSRFAAVLDCPGGGLRIETIHAFCQWLLASFPIEAGLRPGTRAMEDRDRALLVRQVLAELLVNAQAQGDESLIDNLAALSRRMSEDQVETFLLRCASALDLWQGTGAWQPPLRPRINRVIGLGEDEGPESLAAMCADDAFDHRALRSCLEVLLDWNTANGAKMAGPIAEWLAAEPELRARDIEVLGKALCNDKGEPKWLKNLLKVDGSYEEAAGRVIAAIEAVKARKAQLDLAELLDTALTVGRRFALAWDAAKAREGFIDFDDQIRTAAELLTNRTSAEWIRFKLDRRFDHILVDEAQDTNASQWDIVLEGLVSDFFTGEGQRGPAVRTLFVVGDYKQAIFGFQGTSPENFARASHRVRAQLAAVAEVLRDPDRELLELGLGQSFRTARPILDFVDGAIDHIGWDRLGLEKKPERHVGLDIPGTVSMWRVVGDDVPEDDDTGEGAGDEGAESWLSRPDRKLADQIALQVKGWITSGFPLTKGDARNAGPGDVMILVRKRKELAGLIVARLHARGVPVAGVDRLRLGAPLAVKDLVAALRFAAQPLDDLNLASLLVSPLIGWSQEELLEHGYRKSGMRLWDKLRHDHHPVAAQTTEKLLSLLNRADYDPPQVLLHWLLVGPWDGRARLVARLGREANDLIDELLNAAMAYASANVPSIVGFLQWFDAGEGELKREAGRAEGLVRVMTVHGSKGLQAPIVILADAADDPDASPPRGLELIEDILGTRRKVPLPPLRKEEKAPAVLEAEAEAARAEREEHWRLLYVAMTRAEEALFIAGAKGKKRRKEGGELPKDSWYAQLEPLFDDDWREDALWGGIRQIGGPPAFAAAKAAVAEAPRMVLPDVLLTPVGAEPRPPRPLAPSSLGEDDAPDPPASPGPLAMVAARRGTLMHRLIERLPELAVEERRAAGLAWLARADDTFDVSEQVAMVESALAVLSHPDWADVFGPDSLAEVPLAAVVGGRVVNGTVDRLVIDKARIRIVDFKTARRPPASLADIPAAYIRQMAAYVAALEAIHPGVPVEAALLYTHTPELFVLPGDLIMAQKLRLAGVQESFAG
ncbi:MULTISPECIES: double-strand break repair helicase AddA [unclassified Novosphingobium]|uniref:double-strand break repair helicase AddA n=1 Tax=unclassified Novosphingobium TaxID=2644732 RepID=UPI0025D37410|nr:MULTISPECIES: double-strand break repair helicase AddA [unclassified Novosphingobium]HQS68431.1 double-strand break repair helicase AddA [Novosphingobium sp.]